MYIDVRNIGNKIYVRDTDGDYIVDDFKPSIFFPTNKDSEYKTVVGSNNLNRYRYDSIKEFKDSLYTYKKQKMTKIYGDKNPITQFMAERYPDECITDFSKLKIFNIDIEVDVPKGVTFDELMDMKDYPINAITVSSGSNFYVWGLPAKKDDTFKSDEPNIFYNEFDSEYKLLRHFIKFWSTIQPHIVTGWNIESFDIPFLVERIEKVLGPEFIKKFSPYGKIKEVQKTDKKTGKQYSTYDIYGVNVLDYIILYKKYVLEPRENYKLDTIAEVELDEKKVDYGEYGSLYNLYRMNYPLFIEYNIKDTALVDRIDDKRNLLRLAVILANFSKINYEDIVSPIRTWESKIFHHIFDKKELPEIKFELAVKDRDYVGGFVFEPIQGLHKWVIAEDLDSLYPSIIRQWNIGPETLVDPFSLPKELQELYCNIDIDKLMNGEYDLSLLEEYDLTLAPSGYFFSTKKQSFLSELMALLFNRRIKEKRLMKLAEAEDREEDKLLHNTFQMAMKVLLNSMYGALASKYCQYFDLRLAESITISGRYSIKSTIKNLDNRLMKANNNKGLLIAGDTDSIYISIDNIVERECKNKSKEEKLQYCDDFSKNVIDVMIKENYGKIFDYLNCFSNNLNMTREVIADRAIWCKKKRYALSVLDDEGYRPEKPKIKIMGLEIKKSSTPKVCRDKLSDIVRDILGGVDEQDIIKDVESFKREFVEMDIGDIAYNTSVNYITKYLDGDSYRKGAQAHIKAAINYNALKRKLDLDSDFIYEGDKIKYIFLNLPNDIDDDVIGFVDKLPKEILDRMDYERLFEKVFITPLKKVTDAIGWDLVPKSEANGLF